MNILHALASGPSVFRGAGVNHEGEAFAGELRVQVLEGGLAVLLVYGASLPEGQVVHSESTLLRTNAEGRLCLWPVMSELPAVRPDGGRRWTLTFRSRALGRRHQRP